MMCVHVCRLTVGWSWEEFVISCIGYLTANPDQSLGEMWLRASIKIIIAVFVFFLGRYVELKSGILKQEELQEVRNSVANLNKIIMNSHSKNRAEGGGSTKGGSARSSSATVEDTAGGTGNTFNPMTQPSSL